MARQSLTLGPFWAQSWLAAQRLMLGAGRPCWWALITPNLPFSLPSQSSKPGGGTAGASHCPPHLRAPHIGPRSLWPLGRGPGAWPPFLWVTEAEVSRAELDTRWRHEWAGPAIPATLEHEVGSLVERATRPGPGRARVLWLGSLGDARLGHEAGGWAPTGPSGDRWFGPGAVVPSDTGRLSLSAGAAKQGTQHQGWHQVATGPPQRRNGTCPRGHRSRGRKAASWSSPRGVGHLPLKPQT